MGRRHAAGFPFQGAGSSLDSSDSEALDLTVENRMAHLNAIAYPYFPVLPALFFRIF
jgi:hypothetical protein